jgi:tetratricopeptide (TPR) repeat protein
MNLIFYNFEVKYIMKKQCFTFFIIFCWLSISSQVGPFDTPTRQKYVETYVPIDFDRIERLGNAMQARYEQNREYKNKLIDWIFDLKSKISEKEFLTSIDFQYNLLKTIEVSSSSNESLDIVRQNIKEIIDGFNNRKKEEPVRLWKSANENLEKGFYSQAIQEYTDLIQLNPSFPEAYFNRGIAFYYSSNFKFALDDLIKYKELNPEGKSTYYYYISIIKIKLKDFLGALSDINKFIELNPIDKVGYFERAIIKNELSDYNGSISDNSKAIALKSNFSMAYNNRGWSKYLLKKYSEALEDLNKSIEFDSNNYIAFDSRQVIKFAMNDIKGCIEDCNIAITLNPNNYNSYFYKGRAYYKQGNKTKACAEWSKAGELGSSEAYNYISKYCK